MLMSSAGSFLSEFVFSNYSFEMSIYSNMARINNTRKALFQTPSSINDEHGFAFSNTQLAKLDLVEKTVARSAISLENEFNLARKETHKDRLQKLKLLLNNIEEDKWMYESIDKLIGI
jgi:hypothetical protein